MPLMKYLVFVGSALVVLLLAMNWFLPDPTIEPVYSSTERPVIRISSMETLPERVVFDTSRPSIAPPPSVTSQTLPSAFTFEQVTPGLLPTLSGLAEVAQVTPKKTIIVKREPAKKLVTSRVAPQAPIAAAKNYPVREAEQDTKPPIKTTFLDDIAGRVGKLFKTN